MKENQNISEQLVTEINTQVFFREFTFSKNEFYPEDGKKELADNILILDNLLFIIEIKERNLEKAKESTENWFKNKVLNKAKKQIKKTSKYLKKYDIIPIKNGRNQTIDISKVEIQDINNLIIYKCDSKLNEEYKKLKFYESKTDGLIHIFNINDYSNICKYLITPSELDEYLKFREQLFLKHRSFVNGCEEEYIIAHFINNDNTDLINLDYLYNISEFYSDLNSFWISDFIESFQDKIRVQEQQQSNDYHVLITEIAKLKRYELSQFKKRFLTMIEIAKKNEFSMPFRFYIKRTDCAFVFLPLTKDFSTNWEKALINFTEIYKYQRKATKAVGVVCFKQDNFIDINWTMFKNKWQFNQELNELVLKEFEHYGKGEIFKTPRYKFKEN
ncbi:hypothetical protein SAMN04489761_3448 [Tenacibaculum sp. MAR_2009_124]|uniref:hypothetical protein n=1 Tax=Tenacibaculum sp. MAR_2009_124 TaxID=1250059 RepID=UPI00089DA28D|nr:hypothetical protein [Tenacibaculum sp. MAR_2009_124]SEC66742.1 hypothetical protein SAMN04489761_3448 [Tenacibaculum sp. MAR_2009_124]